MENYTITKEQVLEISEINKTVKYYLQKEFPDAFKKELEVGVWYKSNNLPEHIFCVTEINGDVYHFHGFRAGGEHMSKDWYSLNDSCLKRGFTEATDEEVEEALKNEVIKRFGKDWETAKIEKCLVHGDTNDIFFIGISTNQIWNRNGCIYSNGVFAEPLKAKVISVEEAEKLLSEKYGQKVEIK